MGTIRPDRTEVRSGKHILMVLDHAFPPDLRVENEARSLAEAGFDVTVLAIGRDRRSAFESYEGFGIVRWSIPDQVRNKMRGLAGSVPLIDWMVGKKVRQIHKRHPVDAVHAHDLYLFGACLKIGRRLGIRVVGDMHENWVHALQGYKWSTTFPGKLVVNLKKWGRLEREWSSSVDRLIVVIDEMKDRLTAAGIDADRIAVVPNTIRMAEFDRMLGEAPDSRLQSDGSASKHRLQLIYTGGMDRHRGLSSLIRAMPSILQTHRDAMLTMVGDGSVRRELEQLVRELALENAVRFTGWQPQDRIPAYIAAADIGIIPHLKSVHTDNTIPHKLFHYMYLGLPVVASDCRPLARILGGERAGLVYPSGNSQALARAVLQLGTVAPAREAMGARGREAVIARWNWDSTSQPLVEIYRELLS